MDRVKRCPDRLPYNPVIAMSLLLVAALIGPLTGFAGQDPTRPTCAEWQACRELALEAAGRQDYETFHDLAWRAVQTGPRNETGLLLVLARAQSLSGRPHDGLVMLRRLAEMGVAATEALTNEDFRRVRDLPGWPDVEAAIEAARARAASAPSPAEPAPPAVSERPTPARPARAASPTVVPPASAKAAAAPKPDAPPPPAKAPAPEPRAAESEEALRVDEAALNPIALAYDVVSRRFVVADQATARLKVVDEVSRHVVDLVGAKWAGPYRTTAIEIDTRQGYLWAAGTNDGTADVAGAALHKLQLVSGRLLATLEIPADAGSIRLADVAATAGSVILALDGTGGRIFRLAPGGAALTLAATVKVADASSLAPRGERSVYVSHPAGVVRVELRGGATMPLRAAPGVDLQGLSWIRAHERWLVGIQETANGPRAVRIQLDRAGGRATSIETFGPSARGAVLAGGTFYFISAGASSEGLTIRRVRLE
jgi:hypothetical protein